MVNAGNTQGILTPMASMLLAVWLGIAIVTDQLEALIQVSAAAVILTKIFVGRRVRLLMIFFAAVNAGHFRGAARSKAGSCSLSE